MKRAIEQARVHRCVMHRRGDILILVLFASCERRTPLGVPNFAKLGPWNAPVVDPQVVVLGGFGGLGHLGRWV
jgi:hypothetical protein